MIYTLEFNFFLVFTRAHLNTEGTIVPALRTFEMRSPGIRLAWKCGPQGYLQKKWNFAQFALRRDKSFLRNSDFDNYPVRDN